MAASNRRRFVLIFAGLLLAVTAMFIFPLRPQALMTLFEDAPPEILVAPRAISFWVEAPGALRATSVAGFGAPPYFRNYWQFQLVHMAPEGNAVRQGDVIIGFDSQKIQQDLQRFRTELEQAEKEIERTQVQLDLEEQELLSRLAAAENRHARLRLKQGSADAPYLASSALELDRRALEQARREVQALRDRQSWQRSAAEARRRIMASKRVHAANMVQELEQGLETYQVRSDRDGVVVHNLKWNGEKFQIGENIWSGLHVLQIPDLETIRGEAFVAEVDIRKLRLGQRAEVTIDALPGKSFTGTLVQLEGLVKLRAWDIPNKVLRTEIALDEVDVSVMRPAMSIRARIEVSTLEGVLAIPPPAVGSRNDGTFVKLRTAGGWKEQPVRLGESNGSLVLIVEGLQSGDRIAAQYAAVR